MDHQRIKTMKEVTSTFAAWKTVNDRIKELHLALEKHDPARHEPLFKLQSECQNLEFEAERLLIAAQQALLKIKTPRSSNGDSTWG